MSQANGVTVNMCYGSAQKCSRQLTNDMLGNFSKTSGRLSVYWCRDAAQQNEHYHVSFLTIEVRTFGCRTDE